MCDNNVNDNPLNEEVEGLSLDASLSLSDSDEKDNIYPASEVRIEKAQFSISHLQILCEKRKDLIIDPDFQRNYVWKANQPSELIESILMGIPIPLMYLFEDKLGKKQVIDGRQRITTILNFLSNKLKLKNLRILSKLNNCYFTDLDPKVQGTFEDYQLFFYIIQPPTPERIKYDIFDRVNRGGTTLNKQEMRNALYKGEATSLLQEISESREFLNATGNALTTERMKDKYVALRTLAFLMLKRDAFENNKELTYRSDIDDFLAKFMIYLNNDASQDLIYYKSLYLSAMDKCYKILGEDGFRFEGEGKRRPINMPLMEVLIYFFSYNFSNIHEEQIKKDIINFKKKFDGSELFRTNVDSSFNLDLRFKEIDSIQKKYSKI